jgi:3',5'-cyclic AMP phosphodiesterase CpdA
MLVGSSTDNDQLFKRGDVLPDERIEMSSAWKPLRPGEIAIAHLSDLHFGSKNLRCDGKPEGDAFTLLVDFLRDTIRPSFLLVTGDLVDTPRSGLYRQARERLDQIRVPFIVCAGNHDRFFKGNRLDFFLKLTGFRRRVAIVTFLAVFGLALRGVGLPWFLWLSVPAILLVLWFVLGLVYWSSRHTSALFERMFEGRIALHDKADQIELGEGTAKWVIGLLGADSCLNADTLARGYVERTKFPAIERQTRGKAWDLCIFLVHHHLLSIRELEDRRQGSASNMLSATSLVNSGSALEMLAKANVDLVLHGHEHSHNWGTYGSLEPGSGTVQVVAAGSATGNDSRLGCDAHRASFNVIVLSPDRTVKLRRLAFHGGKWNMDDDDLELLTPSQVRRSRISREFADVSTGRKPDFHSEVIKFVEYTRGHDILTSWWFTQWLPGVEFEHEVFNTTGELSDKDLRVVLHQGNDQPYAVPARFEQIVGKDHTWNIRCKIPPSHQGVPLDIYISYCWRGGAVLTEAELKAIKKAGCPGTFREEGLDFETIWAPAPVAASSLILRFPPEYKPRKLGLRARDPLPANRECNHMVPDLVRRFRAIGPGCYALRVPHPLVKYEYSVVWEPWKPTDEEGADAGRKAVDFVAFQEAAESRGSELLRAFAGVVATGLPQSKTIGLYLLSGTEPLTACCVASHQEGTDAVLPNVVRIRGDRALMSQAWCGNPTIERRPTLESDALDLGFLDGECVLICVPIRFTLSWETPPAWGVVRIGILKVGAEEYCDQKQADLWIMLSRATIKMLAVALGETAH